jgi:D-aspartate ligase
MGGSVNGLSFARSLGRRGVPTLLLESERLIGTYTRFAHLLFLPDVDEFPEEWLESLFYIGARIRKPAVIFPTSDAYIQFVSSHAGELKKHFLFIVPDIDIINQILNKRIQYGIAVSAGIPIPQTHFPESLKEVQSLSGSISFPCILKPYTAHVGRKKIHGKVCVVRSTEELIFEYGRVASKGTEFMVQEIIPGGDDTLYGYLGMWDGEELGDAWLTKRKLRQNNPFGDGSLQVSVEAEEVADLSRRLLGRFNYRGFVGVEFRFDARDRTYRLMEINPRTVSGNQLAISAGIDFPWLGYRYLTNAEGGAKPTRCFLPGVKYVNEEWDLKAFLSLRQAGKLNFAEWIRSLRGVKARAIGAADDPYPFLVLLGRLLRAFLHDLLNFKSGRKEG